MADGNPHNNDSGEGRRHSMTYTNDVDGQSSSSMKQSRFFTLEPPTFERSKGSVHFSGSWGSKLNSGEKKRKAKEEPDDFNSRQTTLQAPDLLCMKDEIDGLVEVTTMEYERYERWTTLDKEYYASIIPPITRSFAAKPPPDGWITFVHPEGQRYFLKRTLPVPILTDEYIYDKHTLMKLEHYINFITDFMSRNSVSVNPDTTYLVLEFRRSGNVGYYFVDHEAKVLFWLDPFDFSYWASKVKVQHTQSHIGLEMRSHYWYHNELFPHLYQLTEENLFEIEDTLTYSIGDLLSAGSNSTVNDDHSTLRSALSSIANLQRKDPVMRTKFVGTACILFRHLHSFYHDKFINLHGEKCARLNASQSIHQGQDHSWLIKALSPVTFYGPLTHVKKLKEITVDSIVSRKSWQKYVEKMVDEWRDVTLYATVILNANVAFLTIQSVDEAAGERRRTPAQRASYVSIVTSMGTIVLGLYLLRQHKEAMSVRFIAHRSASRVGLELLALMYCMPYTLLMWSMVCIFVCFSIMWYESRDPVVISLVSLAWAFVICLLFWVLNTTTTAFESTPYYYWQFKNLFSFLPTFGFKSLRLRNLFMKSSSPKKNMDLEEKRAHFDDGGVADSHNHNHGRFWLRKKEDAKCSDDILDDAVEQDFKISSGSG